ncbi:MAG TPA: hypothetical protein VL357_01725 [Rariglobus sp.]|jgi:hypothetical protein|nr:hypothetical protein [Rariglobus sp.]
MKKPEPVSVVSVATGSLAREPLTEKQADNLMALLDNARRLEKLSAEELVSECLGTAAADYAIVTELMNRVLPGWADILADDEPENNRITDTGK